MQGGWEEKEGVQGPEEEKMKMNWELRKAGIPTGQLVVRECPADIE